LNDNERTLLKEFLKTKDVNLKGFRMLKHRIGKDFQETVKESNADIELMQKAKVCWETIPDRRLKK
jgi:hypothetical protein